MDGKHHWKVWAVALFILTPLFYFSQLREYIPLLLFSFFIVDPDEDQKYLGGGRHRDFLTHSVIMPGIYSLIFWALGVDFLKLFLVLCLPVSVHLIADIPSKNPGGKYRICIKKRMRLSIFWTRVWLILNSLVPVIIYTFIIFYCNA